MTTDAIIALTSFAALLFTFIGGFLTLIRQMDSKDSRLSERIIRLETMIELFGVNAAKILHRDDDAYGVDGLLEKYIDRHYELSMKEWNLLYEAMERVTKNEKIPKSERTLAAWLSAIAVHKMGLGLITPTIQIPK